MEEKIIEAIYNVYCEIGYLISEEKPQMMRYEPLVYNVFGEKRLRKGLLARAQREYERRQGGPPVKDPVTGKVVGPRGRIPGPRPTSSQARLGSKA